MPVTKSALIGALALGASSLTLLCVARLALPLGTPPRPGRLGAVPAILEKANACEVEGCGSPAEPPSDPSICNWDTDGNGAHKPRGCTFCDGRECQNKKSVGSPADDPNQCQSNDSRGGVCSSCEADGCGSPAAPPSDPSILSAFPSLT